MGNACLYRMALREFRDQSGREWRVWEVTPGKFSPATRSEDHLAEYLEGWLAFESLDGESKCRLVPIPRNWAAADAKQLDLWLRASQPARADRTSGPQGRAAAELAAKAALDADVKSAPTGDVTRIAARTFRYPGGRYWTVAEWASTQHASAHGVLRFTSGSRSMDLAQWPADWQSYSDAQLVTLLTRAFPRPADDANASEYRRRSSDAERR